MLDDTDLAVLVAAVRASAERHAAGALAALADEVAGSIVSLSLRAWPPDFPVDVVVQRRAPYESQADSVMYRRVLAEAASARGWRVHVYGSDIEQRAAVALGDRSHEVLHGPRAALGPPWTKDHRTALAAAVLAAASQ